MHVTKKRVVAMVVVPVVVMPAQVQVVVKHVSTRRVVVMVVAMVQVVDHVELL